MPKHVHVESARLPGQYWVHDEWGEVYFCGNAEEVHSWLGQHDYYRTGDGTGPEGYYKRAVVSSVVEAGTQA